VDSTFDFDADHKPVEVLGTAELGIPVKLFEAGSGCPSGIEIAGPVELAVGGLAGTRLPDGTWKMKVETSPANQVQVKAGDLIQTASATAEAEVPSSNGKVHFTLSPLTPATRVCGLTLQLKTAAK
jgi:hypothetical protein